MKGKCAALGAGRSERVSDQGPGWRGEVEQGAESPAGRGPGRSPHLPVGMAALGIPYGPLQREGCRAGGG